MNVIWKYELRIDDVQKIEIPRPGVIISTVIGPEGKPVVYAVVDPEAKPITRTVFVSVTGGPAPVFERFIGTFVTPGGFVGHVWVDHPLE